MIHGVINIYKERGFTSHDVVGKLRGILRQKKIGHTGTLDPDAEGVLPVCLGKATKLCDLLTDKEKTYRAVLLLGKTTDTQDVSGTVLSEAASDGRGGKGPGGHSLLRGGLRSDPADVFRRRSTARSSATWPGRAKRWRESREESRSGRSGLRRSTFPG